MRESREPGNLNGFRDELRVAGIDGEWHGLAAKADRTDQVIDLWVMSQRPRSLRSDRAAPFRLGDVVVAHVRPILFVSYAGTLDSPGKRLPSLATEHQANQAITRCRC